MKRENLYRGKRPNSGKWIYGFPYQENGFAWILSERFKSPECSCEVIEETLSESTGLISQKHKTNIDPRIFEDDVFRCTKETDEGEDITSYLVVMLIKQRAAFYLVPICHYYIIKDNDVSEEAEFSWLFNEASLSDFSLDSQLMKVGNIHDNPEYFTL